MNAEKIKTIFEKYAGIISVSSDSSDFPNSVRGFIQAMRRENEYSEKNHLQTGIGRNGRYTYIGQPEVRLDLLENVVLTVENDNYRFKKIDPITFGGEIVYIWGILEKNSE